MADPPLILVVDDEQSYRDALAVALQREGFLVETAADGPEAIARFDAARPALVLLDVMLPKISGIDVCRELRARSRVPIIMVTTETDPLKLERVRRLGVAAICDKSFPVETVREVFERFGK